MGTFSPTPTALLRRAERQEDTRPLKVYYNDNDPYCCRVLRKNIERGYLPEGTVDERDIRDVTAADLVGYQHIHLFAGIGGFPLGLQWANFPQSVKILTGGFPCQDISVAGRGAGIEGSRSGLWRDMARLICDLRPDIVIVENSPALLGRGLSKVLGDLAEGGYDAEWQVLSAASVGAPHLRERIYIVAYPGSTTDRLEAYRSSGQERQSTSTSQPTFLRQAYGQACTERVRASSEDVSDANGVQRNGSRLAWNRRNESTDGGQDVPNPDRQGLAVGSCFGSYARQELAALKRSYSQGAGQWAIEPAICRMASRVPSRVDRLKGLGNAVVPQVAEYIACCIMASRGMKSEVD